MDGSLTAGGELSVVALLCRTSDRSSLGAQGAQALAERLGERLGASPRLVGSPGGVHRGGWEDDLRSAHGCLLEAGGQLDDALEEGRFPILLASDCSIVVATLPVLVRHHPAARVLWLDAHADFNTPQTTPSGFLGGMCLSAACGLWDAGFPAGLDPARVVMCGVRDVDAGERVLLDTHGIGRVGSPSQLGSLLGGEEVFVHLDLDVLDPAELRGTSFPAPGGFSLEGLGRLLREVAMRARVVGVEVTSFTAPERAPRFAELLEPLL